MYEACKRYASSVVVLSIAQGRKKERRKVEREADSTEREGEPTCTCQK